MRGVFLDAESGTGTCGESTSEECACYTFLGNPPTTRSYSLPEMREAFLSFFEKMDTHA
jgi:hypothetical protein